MSEKQEEPVRSEEKPHEEAILPVRSQEEMKDMHSSVFNEEKEETNDGEDLQLPDTDSLREEVNTLLADGEGVERDSSVDFIRRALDRKQGDVTHEEKADM